MTRTLLAALAVTTALAAPSFALDLSKMTPDEKTAFGDAVREYLMQNPEVLVEAINVLDQRQQAAAAQNDKTLVATNEKDLLQNPNDWVGGNPEGDITIVEFTDYKCTYCKKAYPEVANLLKNDGKIRFVVKEFPILGPQSELGARFAIAVKQLAGDAAYEKVHDTLMTQRGDISLEGLKRLATEEKLDADAIVNRMNTEEVTAVIRANMQLGERMAISGTPAFVIGQQLMRGYGPEAAMAQIVAEERKAE
ncbi:MAG: DsbA family protein [Paenirhodobacter sp.]|uniref:DsbA family protein n=1 Tax=Paenirhodobacter sp. TaxID=1965326 RepID=UPI003D1297B8